MNQRLYNRMSKETKRSRNSPKITIGIKRGKSFCPKNLLKSNRIFQSLDSKEPSKHSLYSL
jgi:hypothetical protein